MKTLYKIILMLVLLVLAVNPCSAGHNPGEDDPDVYWFFIRIRIDEKKKVFEITGSGTKLVMGSKKAFSKAVWWGIARRQVAIGPFQSEAEANNARIYYKKAKDKVVGIPSSDAPESMYWFAVSLKELKRIGTYEFSRSPAAVSSGNANQFTDALYETMDAQYKMLQIGPFWEYTQAETAKNIYRENE